MSRLQLLKAALANLKASVRYQPKPFSPPDEGGARIETNRRHYAREAAGVTT